MILFVHLLLHLVTLRRSADFLEEVEAQFGHFMAVHNRTYGPQHAESMAEYTRRLAIFSQSLATIERLNRAHGAHEGGARFGVTQFADLTTEEFLAKVAKNKRIARTKDERRRNRLPRHRPSSSSFSSSHKVRLASPAALKVPPAFDWRDRAAVSAVRSQGSCGACWAHSTVATIESMVAIKTGGHRPLTEFSVQQLVDCSGEDNKGCAGGDTCAALDWLHKANVTVQRAADYGPSLDHAEVCHAQKDALGVQIRSNYTCNNFVSREQAIVQLLAHHGPLIAAVDASTWQHYLGGIIQYHCSNDLNHAVQITGYDMSGDIPFYKVRNTWGPGFGVDGYLHIAIGGNLCGIGEEISAIDVKAVPKDFY